MKTKEEIQVRIDDTLISIKMHKGSPNILSRLKKELATYRELMIYIELSPNQDFILKQIELLKISVDRCEQKIAEETARNRFGVLCKKRAEEIKEEFGYKQATHKLKYLNYLMS